MFYFCTNALGLNREDIFLMTITHLGGLKGEGRHEVFEQFSIKRRKQLIMIALVLLNFALWLVQQTRAILPNNQIQNRNNGNLIIRGHSPRCEQFAFS